MLMLPSNLRIFLRREPTDMRLGYEGLSILSQNIFNQSPTSGHLFVFINKQKNRSKMLLWDHGGFWLFCKRLEQGTFALPIHSEINSSSQNHAYEIDRTACMLFLDGIVSRELLRKKRYTPLVNLQP